MIFKPDKMKQIKLFNYGWLILILMTIASCTTDKRKKAMQATLNSEKATKLYKNAYEIAYHVLDLNKALSIYEKAAQVDTNFFMAYYQLSTFYLFHQYDDDFVKNAEAAINCDIELSKGENIQKKILKLWLNNRKGDASELGKKLIELYPNDPDSYLNLGFIYYINKDYSNAIKLFEQSLEIKDIGELYCGPKLAIVPICMLGYSYLLSGKMDKAKDCFDKYISQFPNEQNPYDCKADYFKAVQDYENAYDNYMKAYSIDTSYKVFFKRALDVKELADSIKKL